MDPLRRAYAMLEVSPGASIREVRRQFKKLVRRWHPDRFPVDPQGRVEAARRMTEINAAYKRERVRPTVCQSSRRVMQEPRGWRRRRTAE